MEPEPAAPTMAAQSGQTTVVVKKPAGDAFSQALRRRWKDLAGKRATVHPDAIRKAVGDVSFTGDEAAVIATLWQKSQRLTMGRLHLGRINEPTAALITLADIAAYERAIVDPKSVAHQGALRVRDAFEESKRKIAKAARNGYALWEKAPSGAPLINAFGIQQGHVGDCYFLAALIALAHHDPGRITGSIKPAGSRYRVRIYDGQKAKWYGVDRPTDAEFALFASTDGTGTWLPVWEKVLGTMTNAAKIYTSKHANDVDAAGDDPIFEPLWTRQGDTAEGIELVTGHSSDVDMLALTSEATTAEKLTAAFYGRPNRKAAVVTAGIRKHLLWDPADFKKYHFQDGHAYAVVSYSPLTKEVVLQNPHGAKGLRSGKKAWLPTLSLTKFDELFSDIAYEEVP